MLIWATYTYKYCMLEFALVYSTDLSHFSRSVINTTRLSIKHENMQQDTTFKKVDLQCFAVISHASSVR